MGARYKTLLEHAACRSEVTDILSELMAELATSHAFVDSPEQTDESSSKPQVPACLGAEFEWDVERCGWCITCIVKGDVWDTTKGGPLARAGLGIRVGDVLVAIN